MAHENMIPVRESAIEWLKMHYPALCEKSGLCERIGKGLYTVTTLRLAPDHPAAAGDAEDAARLDWLDATNAPFRMGWKVGAAPAGNVTVTSVIQLGQPVTSIRAAIDAAMRASKGGE